MIALLGRFLHRTLGRCMPDPLVLAVLLTVVVFALALLHGSQSFGQLVAAWAGDTGFAGLLRFAMQMCLVLVTGHALAETPIVARGLERLAAWPRSGRAGVLLVAAASCGTAVLHWGLGVVVGAQLARGVGQSLRARGIAVHYPLLAAAGYFGMMLWHGGCSGSALLKVTHAADLQEVLGRDLQIAPIGFDRTLGAPVNLFVTLGLMLLAPLIAMALHPLRAVDCTPPPLLVRNGDAAAPPASDDRLPLVRWLEESRAINLVLVLLLAFWAVAFYGGGGLRSLTPDALNLTMLGLGLLLHPSPRSYIGAVERAARGCAGILLQFPLYGGMAGVMHSSGLDTAWASALASTGDRRLLPVFTFFASSVINLFIPSGGGHWAVQGSVALRSGLAAGCEPGTMVLAVAYGDVTNMLQPFWALPLLAATGVRARDIVGYTAVVMLVALPWTALGLWLLG
ncbi:MAG TPA: TIGR00366 family protein [Planctomycetota bacterium]|nr:TIGR00366 family protein [Planctomycetota bacterium]